LHTMKIVYNNYKMFYGNIIQVRDGGMVTVIHDHDEILFNMKQLAQFCGKSYETIRFYYTLTDEEGNPLLPDPKHTVKHKNKTTRLFTLQEMREIKKILDNIGWGDIA